MPLPDTSLYSTPTLQAVTYLSNVVTTMDTVTVTILTPNLIPIIGPIAPSQISTGVYQYTLPPGTLSLPGKWSSVWFGQKGQLTNQETKVFTVGTLIG
jgi:hypothetical protein